MERNKMVSILEGFIKRFQSVCKKAGVTDPADEKRIEDVRAVINALPPTEQIQAPVNTPPLNEVPKTAFKAPGALVSAMLSPSKADKE